MPFEGAIADRTRAVLPITWDALHKDSARYGDGFLQTLINEAKEAVFGSVIATTAEDAYPLKVIQYVAKIAALKMIAPGIDFWMNQEVGKNIGTQGAIGEGLSFVDRAQKLKELREILLVETRDEADDVAALVGFRFATTRRVPLSSTLADDFQTPDPMEFERPFVRTDRS